MPPRAEELAPPLRPNLHAAEDQTALMEKLSKPTRDLRYRAYFWLMDASLVAIAIGAMDFLGARLFAVSLETLLPSPWLYIVALPVLFVNFFVPTFLICARFMRDEYAEGLWRRTSVAIAYAIAALPLMFFISYWIVSFANGFPDPKQAHWTMQWSFDETKWGYAIMSVWMTYMMLFVCIFQFLRWSDAQ